VPAFAAIRGSASGEKRPTLTAHGLVAAHSACAPCPRSHHTAVPSLNPVTASLTGLDLLSRHGIDRSERLWWKPLSRHHVWRRKWACADTGVSRRTSHSGAAVAFFGKPKSASTRSGSPCRRSNGRHGSPTTELNNNNNNIDINTTGPALAAAGRL
jgi:hypothetical protein